MYGLGKCGFMVLVVSSQLILLCASCSEDNNSDDSSQASTTPTAVRNAAPGAADQAKEPEAVVYTDPKGNFTIIPPADWEILEYPDDPRGKVAFLIPDGQGDLRVLVKAIDLADYDELMKNIEDIEQQLGVEMNIEPIVFNKMPAIKRCASLSMQGQTVKFLMIDFLIKGRSHNIQYMTKPNTFDKHYETVWDSMLTYQPTLEDEHPSSEEVRQQGAAKWIRLARIAIEMGKPQVAYESVACGLEVDPENTELLQLKVEIEENYKSD